MTDRYGDKYRVHNWVKFDYSEIGKYVDESHTDKPLRNDEIVDLLNGQDERIKELETELSNMTQRFEYELQMKLKYHSKLIECEKR